MSIRLVINGQAVPQLYATKEGAKSAVLDWCDKRGIEPGKKPIRTEFMDVGVTPVERAAAE